MCQIERVKLETYSHILRRSRARLNLEHLKWGREGHTGGFMPVLHIPSTLGAVRVGFGPGHNLKQPYFFVKLYPPG